MPKDWQTGAFGLIMARNSAIHGSPSVTWTEQGTLGAERASHLVARGCQLFAEPESDGCMPASIRVDNQHLRPKLLCQSSTHIRRSVLPLNEAPLCICTYDAGVLLWLPRQLSERLITRLRVYSQANIVAQMNILSPDSRPGKSCRFSRRMCGTFGRTRKSTS